MMTEPRHPMRRCVATKERAKKSALLRLVLGPDGSPFVDILGKAPGRGVYVSPERAHILEALSPKGLARAFKGQARTLSEEAIASMVLDTEKRLEARILELITLGRRANQIEIGMDAAVRAANEEGKNALIIATKDLSERSDRSLLESVPEGVPVVRVSNKATLGARLGRDEVGIVAVRPSVFTGRIADEAARLNALSSSTNAVGRGRVPARRDRAREND
jgi:predicted RNA-binding protein YlxR (DUF448 family)